MTIRLITILLCYIALAASVEVVGQNKKRGTPSNSPKLAAVADKDAVKITLDTTVLPKDFRGHDETVLFNNLRVLAKQTPAAKKTIAAKTLGAKAVYGKLTADDLFAFSDYAVSPVQAVAARSSDGSLRYFGDLWRLNDVNEFPEPGREYVTGCGTNGGGKPSPTVSSRDELVTPASIAKSKAEFWRSSLFHLRTVMPKTNRKDYRGFGVGETCSEFYVPSPQTHYELAFGGEQQIPLINIEDNKFASYHGRYFSLEDYEYKTEYGTGFAVWAGDDVIPATKRSNLSPLFVVKLAAPYAETKTFTKLDPIEKKPHVAVQNKIYVEIVGIWLYNPGSGEIVSKNAAF